MNIICQLDIKTTWSANRIYQTQWSLNPILHTSGPHQFRMFKSEHSFPHTSTNVISPHTLKLVDQSNYGNKYFWFLNPFIDGGCTVGNTIFLFFPHIQCVCRGVFNKGTVFSWASLSRSQTAEFRLGEEPRAQTSCQWNKHCIPNRQNNHHVPFFPIWR